MFFFFKQKTAYEMRISDWSSDVCSSDLHLLGNERSGIARIGLSKERLAHLRHLEADLFASGSLTSRERDRLRRKLAEVEVDLRALELTQLRVVAADAHEGGANAAESILKIKGTELPQRMTELTPELDGPAGLTIPDPGRDAPAEIGRAHV